MGRSALSQRDLTVRSPREAARATRTAATIPSPNRYGRSAEASRKRYVRAARTARPLVSGTTRELKNSVTIVPSPGSAGTGDSSTTGERAPPERDLHSARLEMIQAGQE